MTVTENELEYSDSLREKESGDKKYAPVEGAYEVGNTKVKKFHRSPYFHPVTFHSSVAEGNIRKPIRLEVDQRC